MAQELLTKEEFFEAMRIIMAKLNEIQGMPSRFITRQEIIAEHKRSWYENMKKKIPPIKQGGKTATVKYERMVYERYLESLQ